MTRRLSDMAFERALADFIGRERELASMLELLDSGGPLVAFVHGITGVGKSSLLDVFSARARKQGASVVRIDCRVVEPTSAGFFAELGDALGEPVDSIESAASWLAASGQQVMIVLDTFELFRLLETWIRQAFVAGLPENARVVIASRNRPSAAWRTTPGWGALFRSIELEPLPEQEALDWLSRAGLATDAARQINRVVRGHPLALGMAASIARSDPEHNVHDTGLQEVLDDLARTYLDAVPEPDTRTLLEACSVARCITEPLVRALVPDIAPRDAIDRLRALPFVERGRTGLFIHDAVRASIAASLAARDPDAHREYRAATWACVREQLLRAPAADLWRCTADAFFLLQTPVLREGFFPSGPQPLAVEPATRNDGESIRAIVARHAPAELAIHDAWWKHHPRGFQVVKDGDGSVLGYYALIPGGDLADEVARIDPIAFEWRRDHQSRPGGAALFSRRLLDRDVGEGPSPAQAACWVDLKRNYLEMRRTLRWVYMTLRDPAPYAEAAMQLCFGPTLVPTIQIGTDVYYGFVLDMGPNGVDGWLAERVGADVTRGRTEPPATLFDDKAQELVLPTGRVGLTVLELGVIRYLFERRGEAVPRFDLLEAVWGHRNPNASNVVDVVIRSLRKKLGARARVLETVRGTGYRYRAD